MTTSPRAASRAFAAVALTALTACGGSDPEPLAADGALPVYAAGAPDVETVDIAEALHDVLELPDAAEVTRQGDREARIEGGDHTANIRDRGAGPIQLGYSGPRFSNTACIDCPPLTDADDHATAVELSRAIIEAVGLDPADFDFAEGLRTDDKFRVVATPTIAGARIDELDFRFVWTHGHELSRLVGSIYEVEVIGTVEPRDETEARAQAETMIGSERTITDIELSYVGAFRDFEFVLAPTYLATTDLGTDISISGFVGELPG